MKRIITFLLLQHLALFSLSTNINHDNIEIFIAIKPSDCISCTAPLQLILNEINKYQLINNVTFVIKDVPEKTLQKYTTEILKIPNSMKAIASEELFNKYSFFHASAITIIDKTSRPYQRYTIPLPFYNYNKTSFENILTNGFSSITEIENLKVHLNLGGIRMLALANDTLLMINDRIFNTIQVISTKNSEYTSTIELDSAWYYAPYSNDIKKIREIWESQFVLDKVSYPKYQFKGIFYNNGKLIASTICYYPLPEGKDYSVFPASILFTLDSQLKPTNYYRISPSNNININYAFLFEDNKFLTTTYLIESNQFKFNNNFLCYYKLKSDSALYDKSIVVDTPNFAKNSSNLSGLLLNHLSSYNNNKLVWFTYYPEFYDVNIERWVTIDTFYYAKDLTQNSFKANEPIKFKVLGVWKEENLYRIVVQMGLHVFCALQSENQLYQNNKIYTLNEDTELYLTRNSKMEFVGIEHNKKSGEVQLVKLKLDEIRTFNFYSKSLLSD
jgi:hypothetical protein